MEEDEVEDEEQVCNLTATGESSSSPNESTSTPSLITIVPPAFNACSKFMSTRGPRRVLLSTRVRLRSPGRAPFGSSPVGNEDGGAGGRGKVDKLRSISAHTPPTATTTTAKNFKGKKRRRASSHQGLPRRLYQTMRNRILPRIPLDRHLPV